MTSRSHLLLALAVVLASAGTAAADTPFIRSTLEVGVHSTQWVSGPEVAAGVGFDARVTAKRTVGFQVGYVRAEKMPGGVTPLRGYAMMPDYRAEIFFSPIANRYFSPQIALGAGQARYADRRLMLLASFGAEVSITPRLAVAFNWRIAEPSPGDVASKVAGEVTAAKRAAGPNSPVKTPGIGDIVSEHYDLSAYELSAGLRLVF